jgi:hypothetical protein
LKFEGTAFLPSNSIGQVKITAASDAIWISVDEPKNLNARVEVPKQLYKTSVVKLNRLTPEESYVKTFFTSAEVFFSSTINNGYLFRVYKDSYFHCEIIKISTGQKIIDKALSIKYEFPNTTTYFRNLDYKIEKEITSRPISDLQANFINVDSLGNSEYVVSMGGWGIYKSSTPLIPNFGLVGMLASAFVQAAIRDLSEGEYMFSYGHFNISMDGRLKFTNESNRLIQHVDEYEIANLGKKPFFKGYLAGDGKIYAFYKEERASNLKMYLFKE